MSLFQRGIGQECIGELSQPSEPCLRGRLLHFPQTKQLRPMHPHYCLIDLLISSVDWALSGDSASMIIFGRAHEEILLPPVAWQSPPAPPDTTLWSDSLVLAALERGEGSPWLVDFDCIVLDRSSELLRVPEKYNAAYRQSCSCRNPCRVLSGAGFLDSSHHDHHTLRCCICCSWSRKKQQWVSRHFS